MSRKSFSARSISKEKNIHDLNRKHLNELEPVSSSEQKIYNIIEDDDDENLGVEQRNRLQNQKQAIKIRHP